MLFEVRVLGYCDKEAQLEAWPQAGMLISRNDLQLHILLQCSNLESYRMHVHTRKAGLTSHNPHNLACSGLGLAQNFHTVVDLLGLHFNCHSYMHMPQESVEIMRPAGTTRREAALRANEHSINNLCAQIACMQGLVGGICMQDPDLHVVTIRQCFSSIVLQQALLAHKTKWALSASYMSCTMG